MAQTRVDVGQVERAGAVLGNAAVLIQGQGQQRLLHRKIHELQYTTRGSSAVGNGVGVAP